MSADASENLHRIDVQLVAGKAVERHPQEDVLGLHGLVELDFGGAAGVELELGDLFTLVRAGLGVHANVALATGRTDLDDHAIRFLGLAEVEVITVTLLSVRIGQELAVVDLIRSRVLRHLRFRNLPHLLIRSHHLVDVLLGGMALLRGFLRLAGIGAAVVGAVGIVGIAVCIAGGAAAIAGIAIIAERHVVKVHFRPRIVGIRIGDAVIRLLGQTMNGESQCDGHHNERDHNGHDLGGELAEQFGIVVE